MHFAYIPIVIINLLIWKIYGTYAKPQFYTSEANNTYYIDLMNQFTWLEAHHICSEMNMTLVEINSNTKSLELLTLIHNAEKQNNINGSYLWTGGIRNELPVDNFVWNSTGEQFNYTNWYYSHPNSEDEPKACLEIVALFKWQWRDYNCLSKNGFVCEYMLEKRTRQKIQNLEQQLQTEIEKNRNLQKELQQQQNEHQEQLRKLKGQHLEVQVVINQKLKLEEDLQAEIIKQKNLKQQLESQQEQIMQLKEEQKDIIKLREYLKIYKDTTDLQQSVLQRNRPINIINFNNIYSN